MYPKETVVLELFFEVADVIPDHVLALCRHDPDVLVHGLHVDHVVDIYQDLFAVLFDYYLARTALLLLNVSDDFLEFLYIDRLG